MARFYRSRSDVVVTGAAAGLAQSAGLPPALVRGAFLVLGLASGVGLVLYAAAALLLPREGVRVRGVVPTIRANLSTLAGELGAVWQSLRHRFERWRYERTVGGRSEKRSATVGGTLLLAGMIIFLSSLDLFWWLSWTRLLALLVTGAGLVILLRRS